MDVLDVTLVAILLVGGIVCVIFGARMLLRGDAVTAEEAVNWRRGVRKQGFDASPDMNPDITDILVRAWRTWRGWYLLCLGIGGVFEAAIAIFVWAVMDMGREQALVLFALLVVVLYPSVIVGEIVGLVRIPREQRTIGDDEPLLRLLRRSRLPIPAWYPAFALATNVVFMTVLVLRLAPGLDTTALARAFALPGMWSVLVVPFILFAIAVSLFLIRRRVVALAPLYLPQDAEMRQRADILLRQDTLRGIYFMALYGAWMALLAQSSLLMTGVYPNIPFVTAGMDDWYLPYYMLVSFGLLLAPIVRFASIMPRRRRVTRANRRGETAAQSQP
ncbi:MAG TPA: hypothetical protein VFU63_00805 [Ktedonobacterales bacterium]|nr:hypothetical protein [Ktedonobacterales bacterium]